MGAVRVESEAGVMTVVMDRPDARNAIDNEMASELLDAFRQASKSAEVRALVLTGEGKAFCAGQDLKSVTGPEAPDTLGDHLRQRLNPAVRALYNLGKPTIAALNGIAAGAGASFALACDIRIASTESALAFVFSKVGLLPDSGATWLLPRLIGPARALELSYLADPVKAQQAAEWGLVNHVVEPDQLRTSAHELALRLAAGPTAAYGLTKRAIDSGAASTFDEALELEAHLQTIAGRGSDYEEGVSAFLGKRPAKFTGG